MNESLDDLLAALEGAAAGLSLVTKKRMFGCDGLFANGNIFGLVWKEGRIGVRLPNEVAYAEAMKMPGSSPWRAGTMTMSHWVLVPEAMHADATRLSAWVCRAHALAVNGAHKGSVAKGTPQRTVVTKGPAKKGAARAAGGKSSAAPAKKDGSRKAAPPKKAAPKKAGAKRPAKRKAARR